MPQSLDHVLIQTIFSTKDRFPFLQNVELRAETHAYMAEVIRNLGCKAILIGGGSDHVHLFTNLSRTITIADFVKETKRATTHWIKQRDSQFRMFAWQKGYGVFSVSESSRSEVIDYIAHQEEHHRKVAFQDEFRTFCRRHDVKIDEQYVWD